MTVTGPNLDVDRKPTPNPNQVPLWDLIDLFYAHAAAGVAEAEAGEGGAPEGGSASNTSNGAGDGPCGGGGGGGGDGSRSGDGSQGGEVGEAGAGAEAEAGAEEALLVYPLDAPSWLDLAEEMCTLLVARGRYATQGCNPSLQPQASRQGPRQALFCSNPRRAGRVPGRG